MSAIVTAATAKAIVDGADTLIETVAKANEEYKAYSVTNSIADVAKIARVQPITLVSDSLASLPELYDIQQGILNIYTGFYLQAVQILSTKLVDTRILKILDSVNPDRDMGTFLTARASTEELKLMNSRTSSFVKRVSKEQLAANTRRFMAMEGLEFGINSEFGKKIAFENLDVNIKSLALEADSGTDQRELQDERHQHSLEIQINDQNYRDRTRAEDQRNDRVNEDLRHQRKREEEERKNKRDDRSSGAITARKVDIFDKDEKTVGKVIEVKMTIGQSGQEVAIPVVVKLDNITIPSEVMEAILTLNKTSLSFTNRFKDAMSGRIRFFKDFIMASDIVANRKRLGMKDPTRSYMDIMNRVQKSLIYGKISKNPSLNTISGIMIFSEREVDAIRANIGGDLTNARNRDLVFENTMAMVLVVVDESWGRVTIWVKGYDRPSTIPFSHFKQQGSGNNSDAIMEMFKSLNAGRVPSF